MKLQYEDQEVEIVTEGYWPEGVTMVSSAGHSVDGVICLQSCRILTKVGTTLQAAEWAIKPTKPAPRRLTNREALSLCKIGFDCLYDGDVAHSFIYPLVDEDKPACNWCQKLRAPNSDEWLEPTSELLEVGECAK